MRYVLFVYQDEAVSKAASQADMADSLERFNRFHQEIIESQHMLDSQRLQHSDSATTVKVRGGNVLTTDGPYAETKEQLGGFYLIEAADLEEAIEIAARVPTAEAGYVEIRPVFVPPTQ
jgi:hypothetical protein